MLFPDVSPTREQVFASLSGALSAKQTRIFLDASLLIHTYEISLGARDDLLDALDTFSGRLAIPLWAANETWEHMRSKITRLPLQKPVNQLNKALDAFRTTALRYIDDDTLPELSKTQYQAQLDAAMKGLRDLAMPLSHHEPKADVTTAKLMPFIEKHRLNSDLSKILDDVNRKASIRLTHSIPPGFGDAVPEDPSEDDPQANRTKGKQKNPYGDIIFWFEVLTDCTIHEAEFLVIVTRDTKKNDWVYRPQKVLDEKGRPRPNNGVVTLPLPLLVQEAVRQCPTLKGVHIVSLEMFAEVLQRVLRIQIPNLAAAIQANDREAKRPTPSQQPDTETLPSTSEPASETQPPTFGSKDMAYEFSPGDRIDDLLRSLGVEGWRQQNQAAREIEPLLAQASRDQLVQIGRGFAAAANDGALEPVTFFHRLFSEQTSSLLIRSNILIGVLAETYISDSGDPKKPQASSDLIEFIYEHEGKQELRPAYSAVLGRLVAQRRTYLALPTDHATPVSIEITLEGMRLRAVKTSGSDLLESNVPATRQLRRTGQETEMSTTELILEISREFVVPAAFLSADLPSSTRIIVPERTGYVTWGPNTGRFIR